MTTRSKKSLAGLLVLLSTLSFEGRSQTTALQPSASCGPSLANRGARAAAPALASPAVRDAVCLCLKSKSTPDAAALSEEQFQASVMAAFGECVAGAAPAEKVSSVPPAVRAMLEDQFSSGTRARRYAPPKVTLSTCSKPEYPRVALQHEAAGKTVLNFRVSGEGRVIDAEVARSSGHSEAHKLLDFAALLALMRCTFEPARAQGQAVDAWTEIEYIWRIE